MDCTRSRGQVFLAVTGRMWKLKVEVVNMALASWGSRQVERSGLCIFPNSTGRLVFCGNNYTGAVAEASDWGSADLFTGLVQLWKTNNKWLLNSGLRKFI